MTNKYLVKIKITRWFHVSAIMILMLCCCTDAEAQSGGKRSEKSRISGGVLSTPIPTKEDVIDSLVIEAVDAAMDSLSMGEIAAVVADSLSGAMIAVDSTMVHGALLEGAAISSARHLHENHPRVDTLKKGSWLKGLVSDSTSLSRMCWTAMVLPGYGQIYNKQYWKLPIFYGTLGASIALFAKENKKYQPLKDQYDEMSYGSLSRTDEMNALQSKMIWSNTRRQAYLGLAISSYIYFLGDAAVNYSTNDVSTVKKATTLAMICPGAGQIYNGSYWKLPFVIGGFASMIYVIDWNTRGYNRFKTAYALRYDYDLNPDNYPSGSEDEFGGTYSSSYLKSIRNSYRRNRDLSYIITAGLYLLQVIDAHVDAHLRDYDISDDLTMNIEPMVQTTYSPSSNSECATYGFRINMTF